jgi:hypothetical protein
MPDKPAEKPAVSDREQIALALDKAAAEAQANVEAEEKRLAEKEAFAQKATERAEDFGEPRAARCREPDCRERMERYAGDNPWKVGTHFCPTHGRMRLR